MATATAPTSMMPARRCTRLSREILEPWRRNLRRPPNSLPKRLWRARARVDIRRLCRWHECNRCGPNERTCARQNTVEVGSFFQNTLQRTGLEALFRCCVFA
jgi:hypothetical protein